VAVAIVEAMLIGWLLVVRVRRRQAEEESLRLALLAEAEHKRIGEIVSNVPGIVWETAIDPDTKELKTTFISDYLRKMLGYTPDEWIANLPGLGLRIMPEEDRERANRDSEAVIASGKEGITQFRWRGKNGQTVWTESYLSPMSNGKGVIGLRGVTLDITQRKLAEIALRHAEEKDRAILNAIPDLMFMHTRDGVFLDYTPRIQSSCLLHPKRFWARACVMFCRRSWPSNSPFASGALRKWVSPRSSNTSSRLMKRRGGLKRAWCAPAIIS
jgi:PAS domain S-box-containing protein